MDINVQKRELYTELIKIRNSGYKIGLHPLGFYRIFITARDAISPGLMLHAWLDKDQARQSVELDIHSHTFDMLSRVITGELSNELYDLIPSSTGDYKFFSVDNNGISSVRIVSNEYVNAKFISSQKVLADEYYGFPSGIFHCTVINKYPTITLMEKSNISGGMAVGLMSAKHSADEIGVYNPPEINQNFVWDRILSFVGN